MQNLSERYKYSLFINIYLILHIPVYGWLIYALGGDFWVPISLQGGLVLLSLLGTLALRGSPLGLDLCAIALSATPGVLVFILSGHPWQIDAHMYFFAVLAMAVGFNSIRTVIIATLTIALHHLSLNYLLPMAIFPDGMDLYRVIFHAFIVLLEAGVIIMTIYKRQKLTESLAENFNQKVGAIIESFYSSTSNLEAATQNVSGAIQETSQQSAMVASSSQETASNVQNVSAAVEELSSSINDISKNVSEAAQSAQSCAETAEGSQGSLEELNQAIAEIDTIIQSINDIAEQTNLLALNATIESARAGEAGKGFAVVASEVKNLAGQTHQMTGDIAAKVEGIKASASQTIHNVRHILKQIEEVNQRTSQVAAALDQQNTSTQEISSNIHEASAGTDDVSRNVEDIQLASKNIAETTETLKNSSATLSGDAERLKSSVHEFLQDIRTA